MLALKPGLFLHTVRCCFQRTGRIYYVMVCYNHHQASYHGISVVYRKEKAWFQGYVSSVQSECDCVYNYIYIQILFPNPLSKAVSLGQATSAPTLLKGGEGGVVLEYENGDRCKGDSTRWRSTLILSCDRQVPVVSVPTVLSLILCAREGSFPMRRLIVFI